MTHSQENKEETTTDDLYERFSTRFVREDGLLSIGKYDHEFVLEFILKERTQAKKEFADELRVLLKADLPNLSQYEGKQLRFWQGYRKGIENSIEEILALLPEQNS